MDTFTFYARRVLVFALIGAAFVLMTGAVDRLQAKANL